MSLNIAIGITLLKYFLCDLAWLRKLAYLNSPWNRLTRVNGLKENKAS